MSKPNQFNLLLILLCSTLFLLASPLWADKPNKKGHQTNLDLSLMVSAGISFGDALYSGSTTPPGYFSGSISLSRCISFLSKGVNTSNTPATDRA